MFSRWTQENYFKYAMKNFDLDYMINYTHENGDTNIKVVNPQYRELSNSIRKVTTHMKRAQANISQVTNNMDIANIDAKNLEKVNRYIEEVTQYKEELILLKAKRNQLSYKISLGDLPEENRYNKLNTESKKLKNIFVMLAYRAESTMNNIVNEIDKYGVKEGRTLLRQIFTTDGDLTVDDKTKPLTVTLHTLSTLRHNDMVVKLCEVLNAADVVFPGTNLRLIYKTHLV